MGLGFQSLPVGGAKSRIKKLLAILVGFYIFCLIYLFVFQRSFLYFPGHAFVPLSEAQANRSFQEISVKTADGIALKAWYAPATIKPITFVFFHGNGDSLYSASAVADPYIRAGYGFLIAEYRGYSGLPGKPTEAGLYADARAYLYALRARGVKSENIILFGHSLGTGVATQMAEEFHVSGLILLAPFLSVGEMAQDEYPIFPAKWIVLDRFENDKKIDRIHAPLLIVNGGDDQLISPSQGRKLYEMAKEPRQFISLPNHGHNDLFVDAVPLIQDWAGRLR
ncbi:MAG: alpha/beta hydrolase [Terracidiphilus sp.]